MKTIIAIYEDGVFRPVEPVDLPEHSRVRVAVDNDERISALSTPAESELDGHRGTLEWPHDPQRPGDLQPFVEPLASWPADPVEWQRQLRDEEWS